MVAISRIAVLVLAASVSAAVVHRQDDLTSPDSSVENDPLSPDSTLQDNPLPTDAPVQGDPLPDTPTPIQDDPSTLGSSPQESTMPENPSPSEDPETDPEEPPLAYIAAPSPIRAISYKRSCNGDVCTADVQIVGDDGYAASAPVFYASCRPTRNRGLRQCSFDPPPRPGGPAPTVGPPSAPTAWVNLAWVSNPDTENDYLTVYHLFIGRGGYKMVVSTGVVPLGSSTFDFHFANTTDIDPRGRRQQ